MAVLAELSGNDSGEGFLIAPLNSNYPAELSLRTDAGTANVTIQASPNAAGLTFSQTNASLTTSPTVVTVSATLQSGTRNDTVIEILEGATVVASINVTAIKFPVVHFAGRFQARFATQPAFYNQNPQYSPTNEFVGPGWTWNLEGEPPFVPAVGNVPENLETPVGREIRFNAPVAHRSHADPVVTVVDSISGETTSGVESFTVGDPLIGQPANLGPNSYFAGNRNINSADPTPEEFHTDAEEPIGLFELHFGTMFSGASDVGPFVAKATMQDQLTRSPDSRPIAFGIVPAAGEMAAFGLPDITTFSETRIDLLVADWVALPPGDSVERRNLRRRINHLLARVSFAKFSQVTTDHPGEFSSSTGTLIPGWTSKEEFEGYVDANLSFQPNLSPMVHYMSQCDCHKFESAMFSFHSDELCAHHISTLRREISMGGACAGDPHIRTVNDVRYDFQAAGEFVLLTDNADLEVQARFTPIAAQRPIRNRHTGLTSCVSLTTAAALKVGKHKVSLQPAKDDFGDELQFFLDGKPQRLTSKPIELSGGHRVIGFDADGAIGMRVIYADGTVVRVTPRFWTKFKVHYMNVSVAHALATNGIMGFVPEKSWLPRLRDGTDLGARPNALNDRFDQLYHVFGKSWRLQNSESMFQYPNGKSTDDYSDFDWPHIEPPCEVKSSLAIPQAIELEGMEVEEAKKHCAPVHLDDLNEACVFDVSTTGDPEFVKGYLFEQDLRLHGTRVRLEVDESAFGKQAYDARIWVRPEMPGRPIPAGLVQLTVDGINLRESARLDPRGRARIPIGVLKDGEHEITAEYIGSEKMRFQTSSSATKTIMVGERKKKERPNEIFQKGKR